MRQILNIRPEIKAIEQKIIDWRRDFHQYPELGFKEHRTAGVVAEILSEFGLNPKTGVGKTGVTADLIFGEGPHDCLSCGYGRSSDPGNKRFGLHLQK